MKYTTQIILAAAFASCTGAVSITNEQSNDPNGMYGDFEHLEESIQLDAMAETEFSNAVAEQSMILDNQAITLAQANQ